MMKQSGFTLVELMVSLFVGGFMLAGVMFTYMSMKMTTDDTMDMGELQESGRLAMDILKRDIELAGFWGNYTTTPTFNSLTSLPSSPSNDCEKGDNNATFPTASASAFKVIYSEKVSTGSALGCISGAVNGSDVLQIKRVQGFNNTNVATSDNRYYFMADTYSASFIKGTGNVVVPTNLNSQLWEYSHNAYYVSDQSYTVNNQQISVPTLMRKRLTSSGMTTETVMEGVENIRFVFGLDTNADSRVDSYRTSEQMLTADWEQQSSTISTIQVFILVRTLEESSNTTATAQSFILGGESSTTQRTLSFDDKYRRKLFTSTIRVMNIGDDKWAI